LAAECEVIELEESKEKDVCLFPQEASELEQSGYSVQALLSSGSENASPQLSYRVNPRYEVGYFRLKSGRCIQIASKVPISNVFSLLGASYIFYANASPFQDETVPYAQSRDNPLQALVEHFATLVDVVLREGLLKRYIEQEENLHTLRGRLLFEQQLRNNLVSKNRIFCRFTTFDVDNPENRTILWTLLLLRRAGIWPDHLKQKLMAQTLHFGGVSVVPIRQRQWPPFTYDRLNERYREVHSWCRFFIEQMTISSVTGKIEFHGFRLNMFELFERFVFSMFKRATRKRVEIRIEKMRLPFDTGGRVGIHPDLLIRGRSFVAVGDAKYKVTENDEGKHPDLYQIVAYSTALGLTDSVNRPQAFLIYPRSECTKSLEGDLNILTTPNGGSTLTVRTLWFDLFGDKVIERAIAMAESAIDAAGRELIARK
jgi:5-methylcytosine-specific restriction enzyme subunit McrC